jgi:hypothetical protein
VEEPLAFVEGREYVPDTSASLKSRKDITEGYTYAFKHDKIKRLLDEITPALREWAESMTSPGVQRAEVREQLWDVDRWRAYERMTEFEKAYPTLCGDLVRNFYEKGELHPKTRRFTKNDVKSWKRIWSAQNSIWLRPSCSERSRSPLCSTSTAQAARIWISRTSR